MPMKKTIITAALSIGLVLPSIQGNAQQATQIKPVEAPKTQQTSTKSKGKNVKMQDLDVKFEDKSTALKDFDNAEFKTFADKIELELSRFYNASAEMNWNASISGKDEDFEKAAKTDMAMNEFLANKKVFEQINQFKSLKPSKECTT